MPRPIYIVIGTRAQFIKMAPLMHAMKQSGMHYTLIYSAQHQEDVAEVLEVYGLPAPDITLYNHAEASALLPFAGWFGTLLFLALFRAKRCLPQRGLLLTHGDTFTAWLAALMGKRAGCTVAHVESGCRSYNILSPFPEELSRLLTFSFSDVYFCADDWAVNNLRGYKGLKIRIGANTMLDGVHYALSKPATATCDFQALPYGLASIHRFENIFTSRFTRVILPFLRTAAKDHRLIMTLHPATRERLRALHLYDQIAAVPNMTLHERFDFVDWIHLCHSAEFVISDGGSNQEELSYLGVPTLLLRKETERREGLGRNVILSKFDPVVMQDFLRNPQKFRVEPELDRGSPSQQIVEAIRGMS